MLLLLFLSRSLDESSLNVACCSLLVMISFVRCDFPFVLCTIAYCLNYFELPLLFCFVIFLLLLFEVKLRWSVVWLEGLIGWLEFEFESSLLFWTKLLFSFWWSPCKNSFMFMFLS